MKTGEASSGTSTLVFTDGAAHLKVVLVGREFTEAELPWDADAISATVHVRCPHFTGEFNTTLWSHELAKLLADLSRLSANVGQGQQASFDCRDGTMHVSFVQDGRGHVDIDVKLTPTPAIMETLRFRIEADQTFLADWCKQLGDALMQFPQMLPT